MVLLRSAFSRLRRLRSYPFFPLGVEWNRVGLGVGIRTFGLDFAFTDTGYPAALLVRRLSFLIFFLTLASAFLSFS
jgi:hypothetical protein